MRRVVEVNVDDLNEGGVFALVRNVIEHNDADIHYDICAIEPFQKVENIASLEALGCHIHYVGFKRSKLIKQLVCFINEVRLFRRERYDFVHIHADTANKLMVSGLAARAAGIKNIILHSHSSGIDGNRRWMKEAIHKICRRALPLIGTRFVACSNLASQWMFVKSVRIREVTIINNGIDLERFKYDESIRRAVRERLGIGDALLIGHVGRYAYQKNHEYLIAIMKALKGSGAECRMLFVGSGPLREDIEKLAEAEGVKDSIIFYGVSLHVEQLLDAMDVFVLPSRFEGLPIVGIEAQASGLRTIYSDNITREAGILNSAVFLPTSPADVAQWRDAILKGVIASAGERVNAWREVEQRGFSIQHTVAQFANLYREQV